MFGPTLHQSVPNLWGVCGCCAPPPAQGARPLEPRWQRGARQTTRKACPSFNHPCSSDTSWCYEPCGRTQHTSYPPPAPRPEASAPSIRHTTHLACGFQGATPGPWTHCIPVLRSVALPLCRSAASFRSSLSRSLAPSTLRAIQREDRRGVVGSAVDALEAKTDRTTRRDRRVPTGVGRADLCATLR